MSEFKRAFNVKGLAAWMEGRGDNAVRHLFGRWALPGTPSNGGQELRLGVRDRYINFYARGQSVAKLSTLRSGVPCLKVHSSYVNKVLRADAKANAQPQKYIQYAGDDLVGERIIAELDGWIATAMSYASTEKRLVDDLVSATPGVLDLEMALPASNAPGGVRTAPRMDIVVAQAAQSDASIAFWEAKCADNGELRAQADYEPSIDGSVVGPKVIHQVKKYEDWISEAGRLEQVKKAYVHTAQILSELHGLFRRDDRSACVEIWEQMSSTSLASVGVIPRPGVVIGNYWPAGCESAKTNPVKMTQRANSFRANGHLDKLLASNIPVLEVDAPGIGLPKLPLAKVQR